MAILTDIDSLSGSPTGSELIHVVSFATNLSGDSFNLPLSGASNLFSGETDTFISGTSFNSSTFDLTISRNDNVNFTESLAALASDIYVTSGVYDINTGVVTYTTNSGATFDVSGFTSGMTDSYTNSASLSGNTLVFDNNILGGNLYNVDLSSIISGDFTGNTSGNCITDFWVSNIYGCSPITINNSIQQIGCTASGILSNAEGETTVSSGNYSHSEGQGTLASSIASHAEGSGTTANGQQSHAEGKGSKASNTASHAEGQNTLASGRASHAEGLDTTASAHYSHAEGFDTLASALISHAEGNATTANGHSSHAEGINTVASGVSAHAEGLNTIAGGQDSHAEGQGTKALGEQSHAGGTQTTASGMASHSSGQGTGPTKRVIASGETSFVHFKNTTAGDKGAYADNSAILGGTNHIINSGATRSVVLGGTAITATAADMVYMPNISIENIISAADDADAGVSGLTVGNVYQTDGTGGAPLNAVGILMIKQ